MSTQHLCDVHLQCLDGSIPFSWYLLSEYSYFASAYQHIEGEKGLIECKFSMSIMNVLCHYMRFKQLPEIKADEITTLMTAADYYNMTELLPLLCQYITHHPSVEGLSCWLQMLTKVGTARDLEIATLNFFLSGQDPNNLPRSLFTAPNLIVDLLPYSSQLRHVLPQTGICATDPPFRSGTEA